MPLVTGLRPASKPTTSSAAPAAAVVAPASRSWTDAAGLRSTDRSHSPASETADDVAATMARTACLPRSSSDGSTCLACMIAATSACGPSWSSWRLTTVRSPGGAEPASVAATAAFPASPWRRSNDDGPRAGTCGYTGHPDDASVAGARAGAVPRRLAGGIGSSLHGGRCCSDGVAIPNQTTRFALSAQPHVVVSTPSGQGGCLMMQCRRPGGRPVRTARAGQAASAIVAATTGATSLRHVLPENTP